MLTDHNRVFPITQNTFIIQATLRYKLAYFTHQAFYGDQANINVNGSFLY